MAGRVFLDDPEGRNSTFSVTRPRMQSSLDRSAQAMLPDRGTQQERLDTQWMETELSRLFFSSQNIEALQHGIQYGVYKKSGEQEFRIGPQSKDELLIVMRSIYMSYARNLPTNILEQVRDLNGMVLQRIIPQVYTQKLQYEGYREDIARLPVPMHHPRSMSSAGTKVLFRKDF